MMNRLFKLLAASSLALTMAACASSSTPSEPEEEVTEQTTEDVEKTTEDENVLTGTYSYHVTGYDWGSGVHTVKVKLSAPVDTVSADTFVVTETKTATDWTSETFEITDQDFPRVVEDARLIQEDGTPAEGASDLVELTLYVSPNDGNPINYDMNAGTNTWSTTYQLHIELAEGQTLTSEGEAVTALNIDLNSTGKTTDADNFQVDSYTAQDGTEYDYAYYIPEEETSTVTGNL